jgi:hypothetical protein
MLNIEKTLTRFELVLSVVLKIWVIAQIANHVVTGR